MNLFLYRWMYWLSLSRWDTGITPPEVREAFENGEAPPGPALDLGCGTGTNVIFMAKQGRQAIGIDFVPQAIVKARQKARREGVSERTRFYLADVSRMAELGLPRLGFALDMGCFHGLDPEAQRRYAAGLGALLVPGGCYMLYTLDPRKQAGIPFGMLPQKVVRVFAPWFKITRVERSQNSSGGSSWFWMERIA